MAALTGNTIASTYKDLLQVSNSNSGVDGTLRSVEDGEGTASVLQISSSAVKVGGTVDLDGAVTINESHAAVDFRVESDDNTHMIFVDGSEDLVGIGTQYPIRPLSVSYGAAKTSTSTAYAMAIQSNESANQAALQFYAVGGASAAVRKFQLQTTEQGVANAGIIQFQPDGGNVNFANNVGMGSGNTSPIDLLDLRTDPGGTGQPGAATTGADANNAIRISSSGNAINEKVGIAFGGYSGYVHGGIYGVATSLSNDTGGDITIDLRGTDGDDTFTEVIRFKMGGNVGISDSSPSQTLSIDVNSSTTTSAGADGIEIGNSDATGDNMAKLGFSFGTGMGSMACIAGKFDDRSGGSETVDLIFGTIGSGAYGERMHIKGDGKIGVNEDNPAGLMHIALDNGTMPSVVASESALVLQNNSATGDGCTMTIISGTNNNSQICFGDAGDYDEGVIAYLNGSDAMTFRTAGSGEDMRITSAGFVGLKTSAPAGELHIHSGDNAVSYGLILENNRDANNNQFIEFRNSRLAVGDDETEGGDWLGEIMWKGYANGGHHVGSRIYSYAEADWSSTQHQSALVFQTTNGTTTGEQMRILSSGRVWFQAGSSFKTSTIGSVDRLGMIDMYDDAGYNPVLHVMSDREDADFSPLRLTGGHNSPSSASQCIWIDFHDGDGTHRGGIQNGSTADNPEFFNGGSDERIKTNIVDTTTNGLQIINGLELKDFTVQEWYNGYSSDVKCDFVAQNAEEHFPAMVSEHKMKPKKEEFRQDFVDAGLEAVEVETALGTEEMFPVKCISHSALIPILVKALQEADDKIDALTARIEALENA